MKVSYLNPSNGAVVSDAVTGISFGNVTRGEHSAMPILLKPGKTVEANIFEMKLFLQANGGLDLSNFGHYTSDQFITGIDHNSLLTGHFTLATGATGWPVSGADGISGLDIYCSGGAPRGYVWLDVELGGAETAEGTRDLNYRFCYDYN